jgi:hypothetical protein
VKCATLSGLKSFTNAPLDKHNRQKSDCYIGNPTFVVHALHWGWNFIGLCGTIRIRLKGNAWDLLENRKNVSLWNTPLMKCWRIVQTIMETKADEYTEKALESN